MKTREELTGLSRGYWQSRMILTAVELGVFEALGRRRFSAATLAKRTGTEERALTMLLNALAGQRVLRKNGASYSIAAPLVPFLTEGPRSALGMLRHHANLWRTWSSLTECVRTGKPAKQDVTFRAGEAQARAFTMAMRDGAMRLAPAVAKEVRLGGRKRLLDLGGGPGIYAVWFARENPGLEVTVVDLPDVCPVGREIVAGYPDVAGRIAYHPADIAADPLPVGADAAFLSHVIHSSPEDEVKDIFARIAAALPARGLLVVRDFFLSPDGTEPAAAALFSLNMLVNTPGGRSYTAKEVSGWLRAAGFGTATYRKSKSVPEAGYLHARK